MNTQLYTIPGSVVQAPAERVCQTCKHYRTFKVEDLDGFTREAGYCHATSNFAFKEPYDSCKRHATKNL